ncbi:UvrD-helicase domain-containing protein [Bacteriovoracaceae bacterium]|nr:UvrD-helicase domain-containing protein [Bacteriovoracaceae bacterium]
MKISSEQTLAIHQIGNVLLEASAGSGKTFVIIEHIVFYIETLILPDIRKNKSYSLKETAEVRSKLSKIVVMTFTNKATKELMNRIRRKMITMVQDGDSRWEIINENLEAINVCTIHSFCMKLLRQSAFLDCDVQGGILLDIDVNEILTSYMNSFLKKKTLVEIADGAPNFYLLHLQRLVMSLQEILGDPVARSCWVKESAEYREKCRALDGKDNLDLSILENFYDHLDELLLFKNLNKEIDLFDIDDKKGYFSIIEKISNARNSEQQFSKSVLNILQDIKRLPRSPKEESDCVMLYWKNIVELKKWYIANKDLLESLDFELARMNTERSDFVNIFWEINQKYGRKRGLTYSDLEYLVNEGLSDDEVRACVNKTIDYFIIDEFQDVSQIQYDIICKILGNTFDRFFAVGDFKQAIYGFRGGELSIFFDCGKKIENKLKLINNYRSGHSVVEFNNDFFKTLLLKHIGSVDEMDVCQKSIQKFEQEGVFVLAPEGQSFASTKKYTNDELNRFEAHLLMRRICTILDTSTDGTIAILYKNLRCSEHLINLLDVNEVAYNAQVKTIYANDPIFCIFKILLEFHLDKNTSAVNITNVVGNVAKYLEAISIRESEKIYINVESFYRELGLFGVFESFLKLIFAFNISIGNYKYNLEYIQNICKSCGDDLEQIYLMIKRNTSLSYSFEISSKREKSRVHIMTAHSSKGLEFDHVLLGGIYTNSSSPPNLKIMGKNTRSFKWESKNSNKILKSPFYLYEDELGKEKRKFENERLLYVACTRSVKTLSFCYISPNIYDYSLKEDCWAKPLLEFVDISSGDPKYLIEKITKSEGNFVFEQKSKSKSNRFSKFYREKDDNEGVKKNRGSLVGHVSELSVTKLLALEECPHKFYLQNICQIDADDLSFLEKMPILEIPVGSEKIFKSSAERGTRLHRLIHEIVFLGKTDTHIENSDYTIVEWVRKLVVNEILDCHTHSERPIKFPLFNYMISGTPDVLFVNKDRTFLRIWDFKTGQYSEKEEANYWLQLFCYSYGMYANGVISKDVKGEIAIVYLDERLVRRKPIEFNFINEYLFSFWKKLSDLSIKNDMHCHQCQYQQICSP